MVEKFNFLDEAGVQKLALSIMQTTNTRIKERITTSLKAADYNDTTHVLASKVILDLIGKIDDYATLTGEGATVLDKIKKVDLAVGTAGDGTDAGTVYGEIAKVRGEISALTHLTYYKVDGDINDIAEQDRKSDVIYLQHDEPKIVVGNDGMVKAEGGVDAETAGYKAFYDAAQGKYFKVVDGQVTAEELLAGDAIFGVAAKAEDNTYILYVWNVVEGVGEWLAVGDTSLDLSNYWSKTDADVNALKNKIMAPIAEDTITAQVKAAFDATDPYSGDNAYLDAWLQG